MRVKIKRARIAFCQYLFKPGVVNAGDKQPAFSSTFLVPKNDPQIAEIKAAIVTVAREKWGPKADITLQALKAQDKLCLHDGDTKSQYDGFEGSMYIGARSATKPLVIDKDRSELLETSGKPYAGCYVNALVEIWPQDNSYGKRVNATLKGVQFVADGDAFAGGAPANEDDFDDVADLGDDNNKSAEDSVI